MPLSQPVPVIPVGTIVAWSGAIVDIPTGWALCDGTGGTPDLRDRFIVGAGGGYAVAATGGAASVTLVVNQIPAHTHDVSAVGSSVTVLEGADQNLGWQLRTLTTTSVGGGQAHENRPPYYALAWIIRTG